MKIQTFFSICIQSRVTITAVHLSHRLIKITDRTLDIVFSRFMCVSFTIIQRKKPKVVMRSRRRTGLTSGKVKNKK